MPAKQKISIGRLISDLINKGGHKILIMGIIMLLIPLLFILFISDGADNAPKGSLERMQSAARRKNVFNFGEKTKKNSAAAFRGRSSFSGGYFAKTLNQQVADELAAAKSRIRAMKPKLTFPPGTTPEQQMACEAEYNLNLREGRGAFEGGRYDEAERLYFAAFTEAKDNPFLQVYALGGLCQLYEFLGDVEKYKQVFAQYVEKCSHLPKQFQGNLIAKHVQGLYAMLATVQKQISSPMVSKEIANSPYAKQCSEIEGGLSKGLERTLNVFAIPGTESEAAQ